MSGKGKFWVIVVILVVLGITIYLAAAGRIASHSVLVIDLTGPIEELKPTGVLGTLFGGDIVVLHQVLDAVDAAKTDSRVDGLLVKIYNPEARWGKLQEIRQHLLDFRASGKPSICLLSGDINPNRDYYTATACEQVWLVPTAPLTVTGLMTQSVFYRGLFDKLKIVPEFYHIAEYKTFANQYMEKKYTPAHREMAESLLTSTYSQFVGDMAAARKLDRAKLEALVGQGPLDSKEALDAKLVDRLGYYDEVQKFFRDRTGEWKPVELARYVKQIKNTGSYKIAVVVAAGDILVGQSDWTPTSGFLMGSDTVAADLRRAREDSSIKAIVFRVDSPGGSAVGSDIIGREVLLAAKEKPVVVSMSDLAASGGYWISMAGTKILADAGTLTGSIGVVLGKFNLSGLYDMIGYTADQVQTSDNASLFSERQNFTPVQRERIQAMMNTLYQQFCKGVADGRHMKVERVNEIGRGRVWTGAQGKDLGLVDEIGGLTRAISVARGLANVPTGARVELVYFPREKPFLESLLFGEEKPAGTTVVAHLRGIATRLSAPMELRMPFELDIR